MTVACFIINHLPCRVETTRRSGLRRRPVIIYDPESSLQRVVDASPGQRIHSGMPLATARSRCPHAIAIPADHAAYVEQWNAVITRLHGIRDAVEEVGSGVALVRLDTIDVSYSDEPSLVASLTRCIPTDWEPCVGVASDRFAAQCAASVARPGYALRVPDAPTLRRRFLAPLPVSIAPIDIPILASLHNRGIHRLGQLDDLSPRALAAMLQHQDPPAERAAA